MTPAQLALVDQVDAASRHAFGAFIATATEHAEHIEYVVPSGPNRVILERLETGLTTGATTLCPHASTRAPAPLFWLAWRPGRVRCAECARAVLLATRGTAEDRRCDHCRRVRGSVISVSTQLPAIIWPRQLRVLGPIAATFGLCRRCRDGAR
jgi:hypothetical protein